MKAETAEARGQFRSLTERVKQLEDENGKLTETETTQKEELETLTRDNMELRAGARWPEWITGAGLLAVGMLMGAILQNMNGRRASAHPAQTYASGSASPRRMTNSTQQPKSAARTTSSVSSCAGSSPRARKPRGNPFGSSATRESTCGLRCAASRPGVSKAISAATSP